MTLLPAPSSTSSFTTTPASGVTSMRATNRGRGTGIAAASAATGAAGAASTMTPSGPGTSMRYTSTSGLPFTGQATAPVTAAGAVGVTSRRCALTTVSLGSISATAAISPSGLPSGATTTAAPSGRGRRERGQAGSDSSASDKIDVFAAAVTVGSHVRG